MSQEAPKKELLEKDLTVAAAEFERSIISFEKNDFDGCAESLRAVFNKLSRVIDDLVAAYSAGVIYRKLGDFEKERDSISSDRNQLTEALMKTQQYLRLLGQEIEWNYPSESFIRNVWNKHQKKFYLSVAGIALALIVGFSLRQFSFRNHGLQGDYFSDTDLKQVSRRRVDLTVDFNWGKSSPFDKWRKDYFSTRWTGFFKVHRAGNHWFFTQSDDGVRLWVDGNLVINDWNKHGVKLNRGFINLQEGFHEIKMEYFEWNGQATARLLWVEPGKSHPEVISPKDLVPSKKFLPSEAIVFESTASVTAAPVQ